MLSELERGVRAALETYSNVHRGSGHNSTVSTRLFEQAREIVLEHLGLAKGKHVVIFCTPRGAEALSAQLAPGSYRSVSSQDVGLPLGVRALAVDRKALPRGIPSQTGGGTARLVSPGWVVWARAPERFEAGTPAIVNVIALAKALRLIREAGRDDLQGAATAGSLTATEILREDALASSGRQLLDEFRRTLIGHGVNVPTAEGIRPFVNLDNGASTPTFGPIWDAARRTWRQPRQVQQQVIREVRSICASVLGAPSSSYDVVFTSNATDAINLVAESLRGESEPGVVLNTLLEHNSNELPWRAAPGASPIRLPVDPEGFVDLGELEATLCAHNERGEKAERRITLVAVSGASNVLGVFNDLAEISRIVHRHGARLLVDAAQLVAHRKIDMDACGIDLLVFSAHKAYAPFGSGVLLARKGMLSFGPAEMQRIHSSGEENAAGIAALGKALLLLQRIGLDVIQEEEQALTARALRGLARIPGLTIYGIKDPDSPRFARKGGVIAFGLKGMMPDRLARALVERGGFGVRYGCHCAHMLIKHLLGIPPLLQRFQGLIVTLFPRMELPGVVRVSLGLENTAADVDRLVQVLHGIARRSRAGASVKRQQDDCAKAAADRVYGRRAADRSPQRAA